MGIAGIHPIQLLIVLALVLLVFGGRGKISAIMTDMAHGIRSFRKGLDGQNNDDAHDEELSIPVDATAQNELRNNERQS